MSVKLIKTLGVQFCKMDPASLSDEALLKKKTKVTAIGDGGNLMDPNLEADEAGGEQDNPGATKDSGEDDELKGWSP